MVGRTVGEEPVIHRKHRLSVLVWMEAPPLSPGVCLLQELMPGEGGRNRQRAPFPLFARKKWGRYGPVCSRNTTSGGGDTTHFTHLLRKTGILMSPTHQIYAYMRMDCPNRRAFLVGWGLLPPLCRTTEQLVLAETTLPAASRAEQSHHCVGGVMTPPYILNNTVYREIAPKGISFGHHVAWLWPCASQ